MIRKYLRIPATRLESFRLYKTTDWMTEEKLLAEIKGAEAQTPEMARGSAFDKVLAKPGEYRMGSFYVCDGFRFVGQSIDDAIEYIEPKAFWQYKSVREYEVNGTVVELVCKADALYGLKAWEIKTTEQSITAEKSNRYLQSLQWKAYVEVFGLWAFEYLIFQLTDDAGLWSVRETLPIMLYPYDGLSAEVFDALTEFVQYIELRNLQPYFQQKQKAVA